MPHLSIIIPTYNNQVTIEKCLQGIRESLYKDYEVVVVDCGSKDETPLIAQKYADKTLQLQDKKYRNHARSAGAEASDGKIIVNVDSDVIIKPDTLIKIHDYFLRHPDVDALTGLLSKDSPNRDFFSQYKNLYMHYIFKKLPERVTFLYGSIHAIRRGAIQTYRNDIRIADDTALGQQLVSNGKHIVFLNDLEVTHLKKYNLFSFINNDFQIPFDWAKIFLRFQGWRQLGKNKTGFAHSPKEQILSIILAPTILMLLLSMFNYIPLFLVLFIFFIWVSLNYNFLSYLKKEKGLVFLIFSFFVTFLDNLIMAAGILCGFLAFSRGLPGLFRRSFRPG